ncbi:phosphoesterase (plasmid) [Azospirillum oryzae]|uniref:Phosphoesterase n=1 Tax=Azospirillum oryzae TaxID=286727 RepID=A0A6N1ABW3_9PROT|nr:alkaline phosphatase family protein [Azospirillum oryzae]KAA0588139.1 phosphoesterase [Azospirillum oryzae]QKS49181.1 phosphoesterase [Azospirillum oryzae]GLR81324.1 phosphoesterase [Azospirillum oryzae]
MASNITNVFVLMLENRSFDNLLGFSSITGTDAVTGQQTAVDGLTGKESNSYNGVAYTVSQPADQTLPVDPGHEFADAVEQLCGHGATYKSGGSYPPINNSGFVANFADSTSDEEGKAPVQDLAMIMRCYAPSQLPILNTLAREFAVCDRWFSSLPGPTWPNRFFAHAASSKGLDASPNPVTQIAVWDFLGLSFPNGTIFKALDAKADLGNFRWRLYGPGKTTTITTALSGVNASDVKSLDNFAKDVQGSYPWLYTFIEPNYGDILNGSYSGGNSQHPMDGVTAGEALIKQVYEAIRNSPLWETSLLIITWDEHGGFYDHVAPPAAVAPGDTQPKTKPSDTGDEFGLNVNGFTFEQYGIRVPAVVVSPLVPKNTVDHRVYDHSSIPATLQAIYGLAPMTKRDAAANNVLPLLSLSSPRTDTPVTLPQPAQFGNVVTGTPVTAVALPESAPMPASQQGFVLLHAKHDLQTSPPTEHPAIMNRVSSIQTVGQAKQYMQEVGAKAATTPAGAQTGQ